MKLNDLHNRIKKISLSDFNRALPALIIGLPLLCSATYLTVIAKDRYESQSQVVVKRASDLDGSGLNVGLLLGGVNPSVSEDALFLKEYIRSADMLNSIDKELDLKAAYKESGLDFLHWLPQDATREAFLNYFRNKVAVNFDDKTGILNIKTEGFTPEFAQQLNKSILKQSELFINTLSQRIAADQMRFAQDELARATASLSGIKVEMLDYQNEHGVLDPLLQAEATSRLINELQGQLAAQETELKNQLTYLKDNTPQVVALRNNINALKSQITIEQDKVASPKGKKLNQMVADYEELKAKYQFSTDLYKLSIASVEKARIDAARKLKSLAVIASPQLPEESQYPTRLYWLFTVLLCSGLIYGVARLIIAIIEDHRD